jgi:hypothetical protein
LVQSQPRENSSWDPILKTPITQKGAGGVAQGVGPEFKPQYRKKKKERDRWGWDGAPWWSTCLAWLRPHAPYPALRNSRR